MIELIAIIVLGLLCLGQGIERYLYAKDMTNKLNNAMIAVMSRNISEFLVATKPEPKTKEPKPEDDTVELSQLSDEDFKKAIQT